MQRTITRPRPRRAGEIGVIVVNEKVGTTFVDAPRFGSRRYFANPRWDLATHDAIWQTTMRFGKPTTRFDGLDAFDMRNSPGNANLAIEYD
jgi:hypothetical protein